MKRELVAEINLLKIVAGNNEPFVGSVDIKDKSMGEKGCGRLQPVNKHTLAKHLSKQRPKNGEYCLGSVYTHLFGPSDVTLHAGYETGRQRNSPY
jgi:hypothetical protein